MTTPEEKVSREVWWVLQRIKEESLVAGKDGIFFYEIKGLIAEGVPTKERKRTMQLQKKTEDVKKQYNKRSKWPADFRWEDY